MLQHSKLKKLLFTTIKAACSIQLKVTNTQASQIFVTAFHLQAFPFIDIHPNLFTESVQFNDDFKAGVIVMQRI